MTVLIALASIAVLLLCGALTWIMVPDHPRYPTLTDSAVGWAGLAATFSFFFALMPVRELEFPAIVQNIAVMIGLWQWLKVVP